MAQVRVPHVSIRLAAVFRGACSDWSPDIHNLIRAGLKELRGHVEICTDSYSVVIFLSTWKRTHIIIISPQAHALVRSASMKALISRRWTKMNGEGN